MTDETSDIGDALKILNITRQGAGNGTWVRGTLAGHRFDALVFPDHAEMPEWELGQSQISKLWVKRLADQRTVYDWDRGVDTSAADDSAHGIVDFVAAGLAHLVYGS
jgi:hypothetical protein